MFIYDELSEFAVIFVSNLIFSTARNVVVSHKMRFREKEAA